MSRVSCLERTHARNNIMHALDRDWLEFVWISCFHAFSDVRAPMTKLVVVSDLVVWLEYRAPKRKKACSKQQNACPKQGMAGNCMHFISFH